MNSTKDVVGMEKLMEISGVPTLTLSYGREVDEDLSDVHFLILFIPGNPGIIEFYHEFMDELFRELHLLFPEQKIPVWGISHAGHGKHFSSAESDPDFYSLEGQIEHKVAFIKEYIPAHVKVMLIGHSIGCHISLELLKREVKFSAQVIQLYMLFPTIMDMKGSPNGRWFTHALVRPLHWIPPTLLYPLNYAPSWLHGFLARVYALFRPESGSECVQKGIVALLNRRVVHKVLHMANHEMEQVTNLDVATLQENCARLYVYFGASDGWCPLTFVSLITMEVPELSHHVCTEGIPHAFVLGGSRRMASILVTKIAPLIVPNVVVN